MRKPAFQAKIAKKSIVLYFLKFLQGVFKINIMMLFKALKQSLLYYQKYTKLNLEFLF